MTLSVTHTFVSAVADDPTAAAAGDVLPQAHWNAAHTLTGVASVAQGGTGTTTAFTQGSVIFAGASGVYSGSDAFTWDDVSTVKSLVLGSGSVKANFQVSGTNGSGVLRVLSTQANFVSHFENTGGLDCYNRFKDTANTVEYGLWNNSLYFQCTSGSANGIQFVESPSDNVFVGLAGISLKPIAGKAARVVHGANPMSFEVYNTYTDASNYERGIFDWQGTSNVLTIGTEKLGTGSTRNLQFVVGGTNQLDYGVSTASSWTFGTATNAGVFYTNQSLTGSNASSAIFMGGTWNTSGAPIFWEMNVLDTASSANSFLANWKVSSVPVFKFRKDGTLFALSSVSTQSESCAIFDDTGSAGLVAINSTGRITFSSSSVWYTGIDTAISRSAAGVIAIGTGAAGNTAGTIAAKTKAGAVVAGDLTAGSWAVIRDTTNLTTKLYYNNGGVLMAVALV